MSTLVQNPLVRRGLMVVFALMLMLGLTAAFTPATHAATHTATNHLSPEYTNGAQIQFYVIGNNGQPDHLWDGYVYGTNQDGHYAAWHGNANGGTYIFTDGWWFQGNIHIDVWDGTDNTWHHENANVPSIGNGYAYVIYR